MSTLRPSHGETSPAAAARPSAGVAVRPVRSQRDLMRFIKLPWAIYRDEPRWSPPLIAERKRHLDRSSNPFFAHAEAEYFLAWRGGEPVGRISAHVDHRLNEFQGTRWGLFGFFEAENDPAVVAALLDAAEGWLAGRDLAVMVGPMDFTTNHECGLLVEGHEHRAQILENWHHPHYDRLLQNHGLTKAMDLYKWQIIAADRGAVLPVIEDLAARLEPEHGIRVRHMRKRQLEAEVRNFLDVYNSSWTRNWGFVPLTDAEVEHYAKELKPILDEDWGLIAETRDGEIAGAALSLLDYNRVLDAIGNGRLLPLGWLRALRARRKIDMIRVFALGVKPEYQHTGVAAGLYREVWDTVFRSGLVGAETGWTLETNDAINKAMEALTAKVIKRYRVYEKQLSLPGGREG
jgi:GNAT superfamily N-acetyltransferase